MKLPNWLRTILSSITYGAIDPVPVEPFATPGVQPPPGDGSVGRMVGYETRLAPRRLRGPGITGAARVTDREAYWQAEEEITDGDRALLRALEADVLPTQAIDAAVEALVPTSAQLGAMVAPAAPRLDPRVMETWTDEDERDLADTVAGCAPTPAELGDGSDDNESEAEEEGGCE